MNGHAADPSISICHISAGRFVFAAFASLRTLMSLGVKPVVPQAALIATAVASLKKAASAAASSDAFNNSCLSFNTNYLFNIINFSFNLSKFF